MSGSLEPAAAQSAVAIAPPAPRVTARNRSGALRRYIDIILFKAYADLQSERQRTYLGFLWWVFEPLMFMAVMWMVFGVVLGFRTEDFTLFLLTGLVFWQWFKSCISHGGNAVLQANSLIQLVALPPVIFPIVMVLADTFKFVIVLTLLLVVLLITGHAQSATVLALPLVFLAQFALICAITIWVSAVVPFVPDLRFVIDNLLMAMMFLSGIFYDPSQVPPAVYEYFFYNPMAFLIREAREILMYQRWPHWNGLLFITMLSLLVSVLGALLLERLRRFYPKLPR
jgi:lipopolysaccharide transport system permease protein